MKIKLANNKFPVFSDGEHTITFFDEVAVLTVPFHNEEIFSYLLDSEFILQCIKYLAARVNYDCFCECLNRVIKVIFNSKQIGE